MIERVRESTQQPPEVPTLFLSANKSLLAVVILLFAVFAGIAWESQAFPAPYNAAEVGAGRVPMITAIGGMISCVIVAICTLFNKDTAQSPRIEIRRPVAIFVATLLMIFWVEAMPRIGFYPASVIAVPLLVLVGGERRPKWLVLSTIGFVIGIYLCFALLLNVEFP